MTPSARRRLPSDGGTSSGDGEAEPSDDDSLARDSRRRHRGRLELRHDQDRLRITDDAPRERRVQRPLQCDLPQSRLDHAERLEHIGRPALAAPPRDEGRHRVAVSRYVRHVRRLEVAEPGGQRRRQSHPAVAQRGAEVRDLRPVDELGPRPCERRGDRHPRASSSPPRPRGRAPRADRRARAPPPPGLQTRARASTAGIVSRIRSGLWFIAVTLLRRRPPRPPDRVRPVRFPR